MLRRTNYARLQILRGPQVKQVPEAVVLLSGGIDSTACLDFYSKLGRPLCALFVDYGQPAAVQEIRTATAVAERYRVSLKFLKLKGCSSKTAGLIDGLVKSHTDIFNSDS